MGLLQRDLSSKFRDTIDNHPPWSISHLHTTSTTCLKYQRYFPDPENCNQLYAPIQQHHRESLRHASVYRALISLSLRHRGQSVKV